MPRKKLSCLAICLLLLVTDSGLAGEKTHAVVIVGTNHYSPHLSMPAFIEELRRFGFRATLVMGDGDPEKKTKNVLPGIEVLAEADVAIFFMRFLKLPDDEWTHLHNYLKSGKPVVGLRTANHSFKYPVDHPRAEWNDGFGCRVLGTPYIVHQSGPTEISVVPDRSSHPILTGVSKTKWTSPGTLYLTRLQGGCAPLLTGVGKGRARLLEKTFGTIMVNDSEADIVAWTWQNEWGARVFATTLGHTGDFAEESFTRMLVNGVCWAADHPLPKADEKVATWKIERTDKKQNRRAAK